MASQGLKHPNIPSGTFSSTPPEPGEAVTGGEVAPASDVAPAPAGHARTRLRAAPVSDGSGTRALPDARTPARRVPTVSHTTALRPPAPARQPPPVFGERAAQPGVEPVQPSARDSEPAEALRLSELDEVFTPPPVRPAEAQRANSAATPHAIFPAPGTDDEPPFGGYQDEQTVKIRIPPPPPIGGQVDAFVGERAAQHRDSPVLDLLQEGDDLVEEELLTHPEGPWPDHGALAGGAVRSPAEAPTPAVGHTPPAAHRPPPPPPPTAPTMPPGDLQALPDVSLHDGLADVLEREAEAPAAAPAGSTDQPTATKGLRPRTIALLLTLLAATVGVVALFEGWLPFLGRGEGIAGLVTDEGQLDLPELLDVAPENRVLELPEMEVASDAESRAGNPGGGPGDEPGAEPAATASGAPQGEPDAEATARQRPTRRRVGRRRQARAKPSRARTPAQRAEPEAKPATPAQRAEPEAKPARSAPAEPVSTSAEPAEPALPETLTKAQVLAGFKRMRSAVEACADGMPGVAEVSARIAGSGRVVYALVSGDFQGTPQGSCIARAVRKGRFPAFSGEPISVSFPFAL